MKLTSIAVLVLASLTTFKIATATTIDFEAQGASAPNAFDGKLNSPLTIGIATFTGGELLKNETGSVDRTVVYGTIGAVTGYGNPLVISFSQPVSNTSLVITNQSADTYTLTDNLGGSTSLPVGYNVNQLISLSNVGITRLTLSPAAPTNWDFAIDNVSFTAVPEIDANSCAGALALLAGSLLIFRGRRRNA